MSRVRFIEETNYFWHVCLEMHVYNILSFLRDWNLHHLRHLLFDTLHSLNYLLTCAILLALQTLFNIVKSLGIQIDYLLVLHAWLLNLDLAVFFTLLFFLIFYWLFRSRGWLNDRCLASTFAVILSVYYWL